MALYTRLALDLQATLTPTPGLTTPTNPLLISQLVQLATGTSAGQADRMYTGTRTLTASATEDLDFAAGVLDFQGNAITFARIKLLYVKAAVGNVNNVVLGAGTNPWVTLLNSTGTVTLRPGAGHLNWAGVADATGYAVTAGTGDVLKVLNSAGGTSVSYDIAVIGASV